MSNPDPAKESAQPNADSPKPTLTTDSWHIDRKVWAGGLGGLLSAFLFAGVSAWAGIDLAAWLQPYVNGISTVLGIYPPPGAQTFLAGLIGIGIAYVTPPSYRDVLTRLNNFVVARAVLSDKAPNVSLPGVVEATAQLTGEQPKEIVKDVAKDVGAVPPAATKVDTPPPVPPRP